MTSRIINFIPIQEHLLEIAVCSLIVLIDYPQNLTNADILGQGNLNLVSEKSGKSQGILLSIICGNPDRFTWCILEFNLLEILIIQNVQSQQDVSTKCIFDYLLSLYLQGTKIVQYCTCPAGRVTHNFHSSCKYMYNL